MNTIDWVAVVILSALVICAVRYVIRTRSKGGCSGCCGGCSGCSSSMKTNDSTNERSEN